MGHHQDLLSFLNESREQGRHDSEGSFVIDLPRAAQMLSERLLQRGYPLLRFMQGVHRLGPGSTLISHGHSSITVTVEGLKRAPALADSPLAEGLFEDTPESYLKLALLSATATDFQSASLAVVDPEGGYIQQLDSAGRIRRETLPRTDQSGLVLVLNRKPAGGWRRFFRVAGPGLRDEHSLLSQRLMHFGSPVTLDGRQLNGQWGKDRPRRLTYYWREGFVRYPGNLGLGEAYLKGFGQETLDLPPPGERGAALHLVDGHLFRRHDRWTIKEHNVFCLSCQGDGPWSGALAFPWTLSGAGQLSFVRHGVLLDPEPVKFACPGARGHVVDDRLLTDASGFRVVQNELYEATVKRFQHAARRLAWHLRQHANEIVECNKSAPPGKLTAMSFDTSWLLEMARRLHSMPTTGGPSASARP